jgi:hypothetical protein
MFAGLLLTIPASAQNKSKAGPDGIPRKVMDTLKGRFPNPEIQKWAREREKGKILYDIEFKQGGNRMEADIAEDGTIDNWEKEIPMGDLPEVVRKAIASRYPGSSIKEVMAITAVKGRQESLEGYEISLEAAGRKAVEVTVAPGGKVLEDSGKKK